MACSGGWHTFQTSTSGVQNRSPPCDGTVCQMQHSHMFEEEGRKMFTYIPPWPCQ